jgi:NAD(P)-dependent dehydrogenase (short-subunit alcohol dehydrogenase family)
MSVLVTGANGGLGPAVCQAFLDNGAVVIGVARELKEPAPFTTISSDVGTAE